MIQFKQSLSKEKFEEKYMINGEIEPDDVFDGISKEIASVEMTKAKRKHWEEVFFDQITSGKLIPAGRILANARPNARMPFYNNCYTIAIEDSIEGIGRSQAEDLTISATGGGVGINFSNIRPKDTPTSKGGESSGPLSFMGGFDYYAHVIHTGGSRRSAHIAILNVDHPDIEAFITCKQGDTNNAMTQFNISVGVTDEFMSAVDHDLPWDLIFDGKVYKTIQAKYLYELMTKNAFTHNEPGILNLDTINKFNNGSYDFSIQEVNPCFVGSTKIETSKGTKTLEEIVELFKSGESVKVLSMDTETKEKKYCEISNALLTKENAEVIELEIEENGKLFHVSCTPDHKIYTNNRGYVEARSLNSEDDIVLA